MSADVEAERAALDALKTRVVGVMTTLSRERMQSGNTYSRAEAGLAPFAPQFNALDSRCLHLVNDISARINLLGTDPEGAAKRTQEVLDSIARTLEGVEDELKGRI